MLDFCPFDFKRIDRNNLAYELVFPNDWTWDRVKRETVVGTEKRKYINENDARRKKHFKKSADSLEHVILLETKNPGGKNGFQLFLDKLERDNRAQANAVSPQKHINYEDDETDYGVEESYNISEEDGFDSEEGFGNPEDGHLRLFYKVNNGIDTFFDADGDEVMYAMPCCPHCHNRLPIGWDIADDFGAVSLMAPTAGGKTTFLYSMMHRNWELFKNPGRLNGIRLDIAAAHRYKDVTDNTYFTMQEAADEMCRKDGKTPDPSDKVSWIPPVFLNVKYNGHTMILGIYDNAGENLEFPDPVHNTQLKMLLDRMFAEIFLLDPTHMNIELPAQARESAKEQMKDCRLMSLDEQGIFQRDYAGNPIFAADILGAKSVDPSDKKSDVLNVYNSARDLRLQWNMLWVYENMFYLGVVNKCDLLEHAPKVEERREDFALLFDREKPGNLLNINAMMARNQKVKELINELGLLGDKDLEEFEEDYGHGAMWQCISSLGCNTDELHGKLEGNYAPIRVAEPIITCIIKRIADNGWMNN